MLISIGRVLPRQTCEILLRTIPGVQPFSPHLEPSLIHWIALEYHLEVMGRIVGRNSGVAIEYEAGSRRMRLRAMEQDEPVFRSRTWG